MGDTDFTNTPGGCAVEFASSVVLESKYNTLSCSHDRSDGS